MKYTSIIIYMLVFSYNAYANTNSGEVVSSPVHHEFNSIDDREFRRSRREEETEEVFVKHISIEVVAKGKRIPRSPPNCSCSGEASRYSDSLHGGPTATSGETYNMHALTAAHRCLPLGAKVTVCLKRNPNKCVDVRINDSGPYAKNRVIDLSRAAANKLGFSGVAQVTLSQCKGNGKTR